MKESGRLFSYIVEDDAGLAPNPYWETCTLAVCKPQIRASAHEGDLIVGLAPKRFGYRLIYVMQVDQSISLGEYYADSQFKQKIPDMTSPDPKKIFGDNFYKQNEKGEYEQMWSTHSNADGTEFLEKKKVDLNGKNVLMAKVFYYYGNKGDVIPENLQFLEIGRGHRCNFSATEINAFLRYVGTLTPGINGEPKDLERNIKWLEEVWKKRKG